MRHWEKWISMIRTPTYSELLKVFCPTGEGGGIDPTCGSGGSHSLKQHPTDKNFETFKDLPDKTVVARTSRGHIETRHEAGTLRYAARTKGGQLVGTANTLHEAKRKLEQHGVENVVSGYRSPLKWKDWPLKKTEE